MYADTYTLRIRTQAGAAVNMRTYAADVFTDRCLALRKLFQG